MTERLTYKGYQRGTKKTTYNKQGAARAKSRMAVVGANRGYLRTGGYYGRYNRGRSTTPNGELKFFDTVLSSTSIGAGGVVNPNLVIIPQDATKSGRNGRKVVIKSIMIRATIILPSQASASETHGSLRFLVVNDKQANGAVFTAASVIQGADWHGNRNLENLNRFRILGERMVVINQNGGLGASTFEQRGRSRST